MTLYYGTTVLPPPVHWGIGTGDLIARRIDFDDQIACRFDPSLQCMTTIWTTKDGLRG
jgi:hypothetical protein